LEGKKLKCTKASPQLRHGRDMPHRGNRAVDQPIV